jgi:hypothetical protein
MLLSDIPLQDNRPHWQGHLIKYADDITLVGPADQVLNDYHNLSDRYADINLTFSPQKTHAYIPTNHNANSGIIKNSIPQCSIHTDGINVLGIPLGTDEHITQSLTTKATNYYNNLNQAASWITKQQLLKVLQTSPSLFQHLLSTIPIYLTTQFAQTIDSTNHKTFLQSYLNQVPITNPARLHTIDRLALPLRNEGFGILSLQSRCAPSLFTSYAAIATDTSPTTQHTWQKYIENPQLASHYTAARDTVLNLTSTFAVAPTTDEQLHKLDVSHILSDYHSSLLKDYTNSCNSLQLQILTAQRAQGARTILTTWPKRNETRLEDYPFIHAIRTRLGIGLPHLLKIHNNDMDDAPQCHACLTGVHHRAVPEHFISCPTTHQNTHKAVINDLFNCTQAAGITEATIERPVGDGLSIDLWIKDPSPKNPLQPYYMIDPTIIQSFNANQPSPPVTSQLLKQANSAKKQTYAASALAHSATVVPLAFTSFGAYHYEFKQFLENMSRIAIATGNHFPSVDGSFTNTWRTNILFTIARSIAHNASEAVRRHLLALQPNLVLQDQVLHA